MVSAKILRPQLTPAPGLWFPAAFRALFIAAIDNDSDTDAHIYATSVVLAAIVPFLVFAFAFCRAVARIQRKQWCLIEQIQIAIDRPGSLAAASRVGLDRDRAKLARMLTCFGHVISP